MTKHFNAYDLPLAVFLLSAVIGIFPGYDPSLSVKTLAVLLACGVLYALVSRLANTPARWDAAALALVLVTALVSVVYVMLFGFTGSGENLSPIGQALSQIAGFTPELALWKPHGNTIGTFLEGGLFLLLGLAVVDRRPAQRGILLIGLVFVLLALMFSASLGAWMAIFGAGLLWAARYWKPARWITLVIGIVLVGLILYVVDKGDTSVLGDIPLAGGLLAAWFDRPDRLEVYRNSLALIRDVPFTGIGLGEQFGMVYARYKLLFHVPYLYYAHNLFLDIWLEQGLLGIFSWVWLAFSILVNAYHSRSIDDPGTRIRCESTLVGLIAILIHGVIDARQTQALLTWLPFFTLLGLNASLLRHNSVQVHAHHPRLRYLPLGAGISFVLLVLATLGPIPAAIRVNQAALLQHRADLAVQLSSTQRDTLLHRSAELFEDVLSIDSENISANQRLGLIALSKHDYEQAIPYLRAAYEAYPGIPGTRRGLGLAYTFAGRLEEADPLLRGQLNIVDELNYWGAYYLANNRAQAGVNAFQMSLILHPNQPDISTCIE